MTEDCTQQLLLLVKLAEAIIAYHVSSSNKDALIKHLFGTSDEASAARIFFISDTHTDATYTEVTLFDFPTSCLSNHPRGFLNFNYIGQPLNF